MAEGELAPTTPVEIGQPLANDYVVSDSTAQKILNAPADNTTKAYDWWWAKFIVWCAENQRTPFPATAQTLAEYVSYLCDLDAAPSTVWQAMATIRTRHKKNGHKGEPDSEAAVLIVNAHRRDRALNGKRERKAAPITVKTLRSMVDTCDDSLIGLRDRVVLVLGVALMGRCSELVGLNQEDAVESDEGLTVLIRTSKTDQDAKGAEVALPSGQFPDTDIVRIVGSWKQKLAELGEDGGRLIRSATRHGTVRASMHKNNVSLIVRKRAVLAGIPNPELYSAHSLRAGGATAAYQGGAVPSSIANHGRWSLNSPVFLGYIRAVDKWKDNPMRGIGL